MKYIELTKDYIEEIAELFVKAFNSAPWHDNWTMDIAKERLLQMINCEGFDGILAYENEKLVGMILGNHEYYYNSMQFVIKEFCVDTQLKGKGIGRELLDCFIERQKLKGIEEIILMTLKGSKSQSFYEGRGFEELDGMVMMGKRIVD